MSLPDRLQDFLRQSAGTITTSQANAVGVSNERLRLLVKAGVLERVAHGVYVLPEVFVDRMYILQQQRRRIIYSHETALFLHGLTDRDPIGYMVTVPAGYNTAQLRREGLTVFSVKAELHQLGAAQVTTAFGNAVIAYGLERTVCDCVRSRNQLDVAVVTDAIKRYARRGDKDLNRLMQLAEVFQIVKPLRSYMEVLL